MPISPTPAFNANVLIVEDDADTADFCVVALAQQGYGVRKVASRDDALKVLEFNLYQVIVMDVMMPGLEFEQFMSHRDKLFPMSKVVLISAYPEVERVAKKSGIQFYLKKPLVHEELRNLVRLAMS